MAQDILKYFARNHADFLHAHGSKSTALLIEKIDCQPGESILEIGFGTGATLVELAHRFGETNFCGLEQSEFMFETAQKRIKACKFVNQISLYLIEGRSAPFVENQFDTIYLESILAIQNESNLRQLLKNIQIWLKPGGKFICNETVWLPHVPLSRIKDINDKCLQQFGIIQASGDFPYQMHWVELFESYELKVIEAHAIVNENALTPIKQKKESRRFTQTGKIRSMLNLKLRREFRTYQRAMNEIIPAGDQLMEGWLFQMRNEKKSH
ncbi:MAG: hypothetical protein Crog4KO_17260 [Crocinitomicaceae bacterium]